MKKEDEEKVSGLPENAYRELKEGEVYKPILSPDKQYREVTPWSVFWGLVMAVLFSAAAAFLGLKVGQVFEAAAIVLSAAAAASGFAAVVDNLFQKLPYLRCPPFTSCRTSIQRSRSISSKYS